MLGSIVKGVHAKMVDCYGALIVLLLMAGMVAALPQVLGPFCIAGVLGGLIAAGLIRLRNQRPQFISLFQMPTINPAPAGSDEQLDSSVWHRRARTRLLGSISRKPTLQAAPATKPVEETFDPRPLRFHLRWDTDLGTYAHAQRSREANREFRQRVYRELKHYVDYGLDSLTLCDVVRKSTAFIESERTEIIEDILAYY